MPTEVNFDNCYSFIDNWCAHNDQCLSEAGMIHAAGLMVKWLTKGSYFEEHPEADIESSAYAAVYDAAVAEAVA